MTFLDPSKYLLIKAIEDIGKDWEYFRFASNREVRAIDAGDGKAEAWLATFTKQLRTLLPQGSYILTHARQ